jgi:hypothetical protein
LGRGERGEGIFHDPFFFDVLLEIPMTAAFFARWLKQGVSILSL